MNVIVHIFVSQVELFGYFHLISIIPDSRRDDKDVTCVYAPNRLAKADLSKLK